MYIYISIHVDLFPRLVIAIFRAAWLLATETAVAQSRSMYDATLPYGWQCNIGGHKIFFASAFFGNWMWLWRSFIPLILLRPPDKISS